MCKQSEITTCKICKLNIATKKCRICGDKVCQKCAAEHYLVWQGRGFNPDNGFNLNNGFTDLNSARKELDGIKKNNT